MKNKIQMIRALVLSVLTIGFAGVASAEDDETPLEMEMAKISSAYKQLGRQARREKYDFDRLSKLFDAAKTAATKSTSLVPAKIAGMSGAAKDKALAHYKKEMGELSKQIDGIVASVKAKDGKTLKAAYEKLKKMKAHGHEEFIEDE